MKPVSWSIVAVSVLLCAAGCSGGGSKEHGSTPPGSTPTGIGPAGGTVAGPRGSEVVVPAGALGTSVAIALAESSVGAPALPANLTVVGEIFAATPHGTSFAQDVTIRIPFDPSRVPTGTTAVLFKTAGASGPWQEVAGSTVDGAMISGHIRGFSYLIGATLNINPVPALSRLAPAGASLGSAGFTLLVTGTGFVSGSVVRWNGSDRTTTFVSATELTAAISGNDIGTARPVLVTVFSPTPGGGVSNAVPFSITAPPGSSVERVSVSRSGESANADSDSLDIDEDGDLVIFTADRATNLDGGATCEVYARRMSTQATSCVARGVGGGAANGTLRASQLGMSVSADGDWAVFSSNSTNLTDDQLDAAHGNVFFFPLCLPKDPAGPIDCQGQREIISRMPDGSIPEEGLSSFPDISANGRFVVFASNARTGAQDVAGETGAEDPVTGLPASAIFLRDRQLGRTTAISSGQAFKPGITPNGRFIVYVSKEPLTPDDIDADFDVVRFDTCFNAGGCIPGYSLVSVNDAGGPNLEVSGAAVVAISDDGRYVMFDAVSGTDCGVLLRDLVASRTSCASLRHDGTPASDVGQFTGAMSGDARFVAFVTADPAAVPSGITIDDGEQVVVRDTCIGLDSSCRPTTFLLSHDARGRAADLPARLPAISRDGRLVAFRSFASNLVPTGNTPNAHVFRVGVAPVTGD